MPGRPDPPRPSTPGPQSIEGVCDASVGLLSRGSTAHNPPTSRNLTRPGHLLGGLSFAAMTGGGERERPLVLVADDDEDILALVSLQLERANIEVIQARDGDEALTIAQERLPDLAVLDVMMPGLNGYEVVKRL